MKIRIIAEQQQKARKYLIDRDNHWQSKVCKSVSCIDCVSIDYYNTNNSLQSISNSY
jgi:hypothetical protein